jgi:hypothetical protein
LTFENNGNQLEFENLDLGYFYFVSRHCSACLDDELSKIESYNSLNDKKISLVILDEAVFSRLSKFLRNTSMYKISSPLSDFNFVLEKRDPNEVILVNLETILNY